MHWRDVDHPRRPGEWRGLRLAVGESPRARLSVSTCHPYFIRVAANDVPLLWARIDDDHWGYHVLRSRQDRPARVLPPIEFALLDQHPKPVHGVGARDRAWARLFAQMLKTEASPLSEGRWHLGYHGRRFSERELSAPVVHKVAAQAPHGYVQWDFGHDVYPITLRDMSPRDGGRVKAWRKHARAGAMPPVLLYWVSGLATYVVLDGHDRLLAASLEDVPAAALSLELAREHEAPPDIQDRILERAAKALAAAADARARADKDRLARAHRLLTVDRANELLLQFFVPELVAAPTRARPLAGGIRRWTSEVRAELAARGMSWSPLLEGS